MADPRMESLAEVEEKFAKAGDAFDEAWKNLGQAGLAEAESAQEREAAYRAVLRGGFIINRILDPELVTYHAGHTSRSVGGLFGSTEHDPASIPIDEEHAAQLSGEFAEFIWLASYTGMRYPDRPYQDPSPQRGIGVSFKVAKNLSNEHVPAGVHEGDGYWPYQERTSTEYHGALKTIEWRPPTYEEVAAFGNIAVAASQ